MTAVALYAVRLVEPVSELVECIEAIKLIRKGEFPMKIPKRLSPFL